MPRFFTCEYCEQDFELNPLQDEDQEERNFIAKFGIFAADEELMDVCENCYEHFMRWHNRLTPRQHETLEIELEERNQAMRP